MAAGAPVCVCVCIWLAVLVTPGCAPAVIAVAGKYRTGKSYLLNLLSDQTGAFEVRVVAPGYAVRPAMTVAMDHSGWADRPSLYQRHLALGQGATGGGSQREHSVP